jgi:hypothetical protein
MICETGYRRRLLWNDIPIVHEARTATLIQAKLNDAFQRHVQRGDSYPLIRAIYDAFRYDFWLSALCQALTGVLQVVAPFTLRYLIVYAQDSWNARQTGGESPSIGIGLGLTFGITAMLMIQSLTVSHFHYRASLLGGQTRGALTSMIFLKSLRISRRAKAGGSGGALLHQPRARPFPVVGSSANPADERVVNRQPGIQFTAWHCISFHWHGYRRALHKDVHDRSDQDQQEHRCASELDTGNASGLSVHQSLRC